MADIMVDNVELYVSNLIDIQTELYTQIKKKLPIDHDLPFPKSSISDIRHQVQQVILSSLQDVKCGQELYDRIDKKFYALQFSIHASD